MMERTGILNKQSRRAGPAGTRSKIGRGLSRKKMKHAQSRTSNGRTDEDSGLGGEASTDSVFEESPGLTYFLGVKEEADNLDLPTFGKKSKNYSNFESKPKRMRLDMTEEANELPEQKLDTSRTAQQILSFKNVPDLKPTLSPSCLLNPQKIFPSNGFQSFLQPSSILKPRQVVQPVVQLVGKVEKQSKLEPNSESSDGAIFLELLSQPESQHRARYQTEGSRGAVKDRSGQGHPIVKLNGYYHNTILKVFVASDGDTVSPHMFYQACKVSGKNSSPCSETKVDGTVILEIDMLPEQDMTVSCDCVGILKERNVDVEKRLKKMISGGPKKSHKCRLVFRTSVTLKSGKREELQVVSQPICCSQPPGLPEISRKSLSKCSVEGGEEIFIIGKNFSKDTEVIFQQSRKKHPVWSQKVLPDKEYLQGTHLICQVPPYHDTTITESVEVQVVVVSNSKKSDPQPFTYEPLLDLPRGRLNSVQLQSLPKGVSPTAVELNKLYAQSEDKTALDFPTSFSSKQAASVRNLESQNVKEKGVGHPVVITCAKSGDNYPAISAKMDNVNSIIPTSALSNSKLVPTVISSTPVSAVSSVLVDRKIITLPPHSISINVPHQKFHNNECKTFIDNKTKEVIKTDISDTVVLENLCHMLKLVNTLPTRVHSSLLELLSNELLMQIKGKGSSLDKPISSCETNLTNKSNATTSSAIIKPQQTPGDRNVTADETNPLKTESNISCENFNTSFTNQILTSNPNASYFLPMAVIPPINSSKATFSNQREPYMNTSTQPAVGSVSFQNVSDNINKQPIQVACSSNNQQFDAESFEQNQKFGTSMIKPMHLKEDTMYDPVHSVNMTRKFVGSTESDYGRDVHNALKSPNVNLPVTFSTSEQCDGMKEVASIDSLFSSSSFSNQSQQVGSMALNHVFFTPKSNTAPRKDLIMPNQLQQEQVFARRHILPELSTKMTFIPNSLLHSQLTRGKLEQSSMVEQVNGNVQVQYDCFSNQNILDDHLQQHSHISEASPALHSYASDLEPTINCSIANIRSSQTYDLSSVMQMENCDPLLSQASSSSSLRLVQSLPDSISSNSLNSANSSVSSEVTISQLSESELINFINPNCFDNV